MRTAILVVILSALTATSVSCNKGANQTASSQDQSGIKHYQLKGKVVSIDKKANMANIDGEDVPGFMDAMTMPYVVKPTSELDKLSPGDAITADIVVQGETSWIENVKITGHDTTVPPK
jgi:protein SCO1/2